VHAALDLFKNSGQQAAITAALNESRGGAIVLIDSDLQLAPEELPVLLAQWDKGFDLVTGYRVERKDSLFRIAPSLLANMIMRRASHSSIRDFGCTFKIYNAGLLRAFQFGPRHVFTNVEAIARIDRIIEVPVSHRPRKYGKSGFTFRKLMKYNMDNMVILSERPFQFIALICLIVAVLFGCRLVLDRVVPVKILAFVSNGLLLNVMVISLLVNVALISLIGEFAIRSFYATRNVPLYIVRETLRRSGQRAEEAVQQGWGNAAPTRGED
jgi:glycosyltransferase involved in cell wall biosynthesis